VLPVTPVAAPAVDALAEVKLAFDAAAAAAQDAQQATQAFEARARELATATAMPARDDTAVAHVGELENKLGSALANLETVAAQVDAAARAVFDAAGATSSPDAVDLVDEATALAREASRIAALAHGKATDAMKKADDYIRVETGDWSFFIAAADAAIAAGNFDDAKQNLDKAAKLIHRSGAKNTGLEYSYARLYDANAERTHDQASKRKLLQQAKDAYQRFAKTGTGPRLQRAHDRLTEITEEIKELDPP
jgi:tetratricopeptide (TPR) repeat protein